MQFGEKERFEGVLRRYGPTELVAKYPKVQNFRRTSPIKPIMGGYLPRPASTPGQFLLLRGLVASVFLVGARLNLLLVLPEQSSTIC